MADPWRSWSELAGAAWRHRLDLPGATLAAEVTGLEQRDDVWTWTLDQVWRTPEGGLVLVRRSRSTGVAEDALVVVQGGGPAALARAVFAALGRSPGLLELLGRAGIELGLAPDDVVEGDEIDDWPDAPPPAREVP